MDLRWGSLYKIESVEQVLRMGVGKKNPVEKLVPKAI